MADPASMRQLFQRMMFTQEASAALTDQQGLNSLGELRMLTDDECTTICKTLKRPGGTIDDGHGNAINNPGHSVSLVAEKNLKLAVYYLKHQERCSTVAIYANVTLDNVRALKSLYDLEKSYSKPNDPDPEKIINTRDWTKTMDAIDEHLESVLGVQGVPLKYIVRKNAAPQDPPAGGWISEHDRMIGRAPHFTTDAAGQPTANHTNAYRSDNLKVWTIMSGLTRNSGDCWTYVKAGQPRKDGRAAYLALYEHYLGSHNVEIQANYHEARLRTNKYYGEKRRHNFHKYATDQLDSIQHLNNLVPYGYAGVDQRSAVRYLTEGIEDSSLDSTKNTILATETLRTDFTACVALFKDFIASRKLSSKQQNFNVSDVSSQQKKNGNGKPNARATRGQTGVEFRYYKQSEYKKLSNEQKEELKNWRDNRDSAQPPAKRRRGNNNNNSPFNTSALAQSLVSAMQSANIGGTTTAADSQEDGEITNDAATQQTSNRSNRSLTRQSGSRR